MCELCYLWVGGLYFVLFNKPILISMTEDQRHGLIEQMYFYALFLRHLGERTLSVRTKQNDCPVCSIGKTKLRFNNQKTKNMRENFLIDEGNVTKIQKPRNHQHEHLSFVISLCELFTN